MSNLAGTPKFTSIILIWDPPQEPNGVIISYEVTYTVDGNNTVRVNTSDLSTTFTIPSLTPQTRVSDITVTAYTRIGRGEPANLSDQSTFEAPSESINVSTSTQIHIQGQHVSQIFHMWGNLEVCSLGFFAWFFLLVFQNHKIHE